MKLVIMMGSGEIQEVDDFASIKGVTSNGQHYQLSGCILADFTTGPNGSEIQLLHPQTTAQTGHVDVIVRYGCLIGPTFHRYSGSEKFIPSESSSLQYMIWPTGGWSLIQTVLLIEDFLSSKSVFTRKLRGAIFAGLQLTSPP